MLYDRELEGLLDEPTPKPFQDHDA